MSGGQPQRVPGKLWSDWLVQTVMEQVPAKHDWFQEETALFQLDYCSLIICEAGVEFKAALVWALI